ncbi:MAG: ADP-forming succinate--CoA ligase subunit beta [Burkholderia sp.]|nr:ADP-forming succinate--CoA ligase subunit beta [Burkholderia sp.]
MKIHEYQGKEILRKFGVAVPRGKPAFSVDEALKVAEELGGPFWAVKAQIHAGGRGKCGGIRIANSINQVREYASQMLGMQLVTHQTSPKGQKVNRLLIEEGTKIRKEFYIGIIIDRLSQKIVVMASSEGGVDIEEVASKIPESIYKVRVQASNGLQDNEADNLTKSIQIPDILIPQARKILKGLYKSFLETDALLAEINPLVLTEDDKIIALDAKFDFDLNALFRHPEIVVYRDLDEEDPDEIRASKFGLAYIPLDGNIGCLVNGAGLAMATMDTIKLFGGKPANFLDVGGGATIDKVIEAFKIMLKKKDLKAILVNIFGGIMHCDVIAEGVISGSKAVNLNIPLVVRMNGTNEDLGKRMLMESNLPIISANSMEEAAKKVIEVTKGN